SVTLSYLCLHHHWLEIARPTAAPGVTDQQFERQSHRQRVGSRHPGQLLEPSARPGNSYSRPAVVPSSHNFANGQGWYTAQHRQTAQKPAARLNCHAPISELQHLFSHHIRPRSARNHHWLQRTLGSDLTAAAP